MANIQSTDNFSLMCTIKTDLSRAKPETRKVNGKTVYRIDLELILLFGLTEMQAQVAWKEKVRVRSFYVLTLTGSEYLFLVFFRVLRSGETFRELELITYGLMFFSVALRRLCTNLENLRPENSGRPRVLSDLIPHDC